MVDRKDERLFTHSAGLKGVLQVDGYSACPNLQIAVRSSGMPELLAGFIPSMVVPKAERAAPIPAERLSALLLGSQRQSVEGDLP